jgi:hypothetical protein
VPIPSEKRCTGKCGLVRPASDFFVIRDKRNWKGLSAACRECTAERKRDWRDQNRERHNANARRYAAENSEKINVRRRRDALTDEQVERERDRVRRLKYGLLLGAYAALLEAQGGACAICRKPETATYRGKVRALAVDHSPNTGEVRGLLCFRCNVGLGKFGDDAERLRAAADYLEAAR